MYLFSFHSFNTQRVYVHAYFQLELIVIAKIVLGKANIFASSNRNKLIVLRNVQRTDTILLSIDAYFFLQRLVKFEFNFIYPCYYRNTFIFRTKDIGRLIAVSPPKIRRLKSINSY